MQENLLRTTSDIWIEPFIPLSQDSWQTLHTDAICPQDFVENLTWLQWEFHIWHKRNQIKMYTADSSHRCEDTTHAPAVHHYLRGSQFSTVSGGKKLSLICLFFASKEWLVTVLWLWVTQGVILQHGTFLHKFLNVQTLGCYVSRMQQANKVSL